jgi:hypothetical protein
MRLIKSVLKKTCNTALRRAKILRLNIIGIKVLNDSATAGGTPSPRFTRSCLISENFIKRVVAKRPIKMPPNNPLVPVFVEINALETLAVTAPLLETVRSERPEDAIALCALVRASPVRALALVSVAVTVCGIKVTRAEIDMTTQPIALSKCLFFAKQ